jgi:hypothetical protein
MSAELQPEKNTMTLTADSLAVVCRDREAAFARIEQLIPIALRTRLREKIQLERAQLVALEARGRKRHEQVRQAAADLPAAYFEKKRLERSFIE